MPKGVDSRAVIAELIGTFVLVFIGTATAVFAGSGLISSGMGLLAIAFAFGFTLMVLVYAIGRISGCHVNPAVTIAMVAARKISGKGAISYIIAQIVGAVIASGVLFVILSGMPAYSLSGHGLGANNVPDFFSVQSAFVLEIVLTALFLFVIFFATSPKARESTQGLAIGGYLFVAHLIGVPLAGSSLNPARSIGPALLQGGSALGNLWIFIVAPIIGGLIGYVMYKAVENRMERGEIR
ncbi:MAG: aquaporin [Candidatus Aenigmarchaeota archaeon]|nr:aquaporin [Candidatus Aenigmarchaeota archaeon]